MDYALVYQIGCMSLALTRPKNGRTIPTSQDKQGFESLIVITLLHCTVYE
jgi:hypothetical protein